jgi:hypothetical protein
VEDLQKFGLTKTPSPPWVLTHRVLIPLNPSCVSAAEILVRALGGAELATKMAGGTKWWRVRMQAGVEGEWIGIKKDFRNEEIRRKQAEDAQKQKKKDKKDKDKGKHRFGLGLHKKDHKDDKEEHEEEPSDDGVEGECEIWLLLVDPVMSG